MTYLDLLKMEIENMDDGQALAPVLPLRAVNPNFETVVDVLTENALRKLYCLAHQLLKTSVSHG